MGGASTETYLVSFQVMVIGPDASLSKQRVGLNVEASSAENAAAQLADALQTVIAAERRFGAKESKAK